MLIRNLYFLALLFAALALGPALAHLLELPNKLPLERDAYFTVQQIYAGWSLLGIVVFGALASSCGLTLALWRRGRAFGAALVGFLALVGTQAIFWIFTWPANRATANWTESPAEWETLRAQWEWSHAAAAGLNLLAFVALLLSLLSRLHLDRGARGKEAQPPGPRPSSRGRDREPPPGETRR